MLTGGIATATAGDGPDEYTVKAAILYKFIRYVEWPAAAGKQLTICVIGNDPFGSRLDAIEKKSSAELTLKVMRNVSASQVSQCHLAYISSGGDVSGVLSKVSGQPVLTISDASGFSEQGGIVEFMMTEDNKVKFSINLKSANAAQLRLDPQLLEIATSVLR